MLRSHSEKSRYDNINDNVPTNFNARRMNAVARIEKGIDGDGDQYIHAIYPTPNKVKSEQLVDLSYLCVIPNMADALADGFLEWGKQKSVNTRLIAALNIKIGWVAFLVEKNLQHMTISEIDTSIVNLLSDWFNQEVDGKQRWAIKTRQLRFAIFISVLRQIQNQTKWRGIAPENVYVRCSWHGVSRRGKPRKVLPHDMLALIYAACVKEVTETITTIKEGWNQLAIVGNQIDSCANYQFDYSNQWECLHYIRRNFEGVLPHAGAIKASDPQLARKLKEYHGGWKSLSRFWIPSPRDFVPFALLLGIHFAYNPDALLQSSVSDYETYTTLGEQRVRGRVSKGRSGRRQLRSLPATDDPDNPATLIEFIQRWTEWVRHFAPLELQDRLFLFPRILTSGGIAEVKSYGHDKLGASGCGFWVDHLKAFIIENELEKFTLVQIRTTVLDFAHELFGGDLRAVKAVGQQQNPQVIISHYTSDAARQRNDESLAQILALRNRYRETDGQVDSRSSHADEDVGGATPGWRCLDPYSSPILAFNDGKLCSALGMCPSCPHANINLESAYVCARVYQLLDEIKRLQGHIMPQAWLDKWAPIADRLLNYWMPKFDSKTIEDARRLADTLPPFPSLE